MTERLRPLPPEDWTDAQRTAAQDIADERGMLDAPFVPLLRSPGLMTHVQRLGACLRDGGVLGPRLAALAILATAREWDQQAQWAIHAPAARGAGIPPEVIDAIAQRRRPPAMLIDEAVVYDFCVELHRDRRVSDRTYADALALFGEQGVVELAGINGYYTFLAMVMNTAQTAAPPSGAAPLPELKRRG